MTRSVMAWLKETAARVPDAPAFETPTESRTWGQILTRARQIGSAVAARTGGQTPVMLLMEKSPALAEAMFGTVYAGCFYTPVDTSMPKARMRLMAETLKPALILCEEKLSDLARELGGEVLAAEQIPETEDAALLNARRAQHIDTDLLYVLFTSGSTGVPKGVSITHRSVVDFIEWACDALRLPAGPRFASQAPFYFDNSVLDIYCAMRTGGSVFLIPRGDFLFPKRLLAALSARHIDTLFWVPSALTALAGSGILTPGCLPKLRRIFFCGEVMPCRTLNLLREAVPDADYVNMYGPTEITDVCAWYRVDREFADGDSLPIGFPCANTRIVLIDGELCVGGTCLSPGYYNAPEKTATAFIQNPLRPQIREILYRTGDLAEYNERGELLFLGRMDSQIKRNGYRIELGEIETALNTVEGVTLACCWYEQEAERITAAYTGKAQEKEVRRALKAHLPRYMLPDVFLHRETLPRTGSGKLDRIALRREVQDEHPDR